jgi:hypothetical protein
MPERCVSPRTDFTLYSWGVLNRETRALTPGERRCIEHRTLLYHSLLPRQNRQLSSESRLEDFSLILRPQLGQSWLSSTVFGPWVIL